MAKRIEQDRAGGERAPHPGRTRVATRPPACRAHGMLWPIATWPSGVLPDGAHPPPRPRRAHRQRPYLRSDRAVVPLEARGFRVQNQGRARLALGNGREDVNGGSPGCRAMDWMTLSPEEWTAVRLSLRVATVATLVSLPLGIGIALALARGRFWGQSLLNGIVLLPLILPPVVTGYALLILFGRRGPAGRFFADHLGIVFSFRWTGAALACGVMGFPLLVRAIRLSIEGVDARLEEAAGTLGAKRIWVFATVTLPLIVPGILTGMILCFAKAMGEFGATITFVSNIPGETQTLPSAIYAFTQVPGGDAGALRLALVSVAISMLALLASELMARFANRRLDIE